MYALPVATVVGVALIWFVNISNMQVASKLITAMSPDSTKGLAGNITVIEELLAQPPFAAQEIREQLVSLAMNVGQQSGISDADKKKVIALAITEMKKQVEAYPQDARGHLQLAYAYRVGGDAQNALKEILTAAELSPNKEQMWIEAGAAEWDLGNMKEAQMYFNKVYMLGAKYPELAVYAAAGNLAVGDIAAANKILMDTYGTINVDSDVLAVAYYRTKNWKSLVGIWKLRAEKSEATPQTWFSLAAAYYVSGDKWSAVQTINEAVKRFPEAATSGAEAIKQIQAP